MRYFVLLILAASIGCQTEPVPEAHSQTETGGFGRGAIAFTAEREQYAPGAEVKLSLRNTTDLTLGYNLCFSDLERQSGSGWEKVPDDTVCTTVQHGLETGETADYTKTLAAGLPQGTYRFTTSVERRGENRQERVSTGAFQVKP